MSDQHQTTPPTEAEIEAEVQRILAMSDEEIEADAWSRGEDPAAAKAWGLAIFHAAMNEVARGKR